MKCKFQLIIVAALFISGIATGQNTAETSTVIIKTRSSPVKMERLATLSEPWGFTFLPDGRLIIAEKPDRLRIYTGNPG